MATTTPKTPWADTPFALLKIPGTPGAPTSSNPGILHVCIEMANVHNLLLRGLNSIYNQAPFVTLPGDISDLMLYTTAWADTIHHHHSAEETLFFPQVEALAKAAGQECDMAGNVAQHQGFEGGMAEMVAWAKRVRDGEVQYDAEVLKGLIDGFAPLLTQHLHEEIETLVGLEKCDGEEVRRAMKETADEGAKTADPNLVIPLIMGCLDKNYPGSEDFPPLPFFVPWLNAYWFSRKHGGCWRFNPSDHWGRPRPLHFLK
ncbi:hypothetical protein COCCADRAFT_95040 [Bipolaris zeicola 26-R-13]|uniref:Hemerythrin-like domain-containing protein n=1 Tax=Cochliobolus carbonum (strain 26-R-13) TaxID=930089 RepID=W6YQV6_COCC2|nr:uncharacterized protein COCCADRAFT_95040 [Bipolaris zeicola 26-R-13]EUC33856.1 hypothetical protein COCCADRAFT_95040 [Bipolaris zeicola 26-R-13]